MQFRLLGPLEVAEQNRAAVLGGVKQRSLLAILLLHANEVVSTDRLIGELWGESPPATMAKRVQRCVMRLRRDLGAERLRTRPPGYVLNVAPDELELAVGVSPTDPDLTPDARRFVSEFGASAGEDGVLEAAQAAESVLAAIARSDGTRASVLDELRATRERDGILRDLAFDRYGDVTPARFTILRVTGDAPADTREASTDGLVGTA
jgi:DNA-binding SARP family transcriptional activator